MIKFRYSSDKTCSLGARSRGEFGVSFKKVASVPHDLHPSVAVAVLPPHDFVFNRNAALLTFRQSKQRHADLTPSEKNVKGHPHLLM